MRKKTTVYIPQQNRSIDLPSALARLLTEIMVSGNKGVTSLELGAVGIIHASQGVKALRDLGAVISSKLELYTDNQGQKRPNVARYRFHDWIFLDLENELPGSCSENSSHLETLDINLAGH